MNSAPPKPASEKIENTPPSSLKNISSELLKRRPKAMTLVVDKATPSLPSDHKLMTDISEEKKDISDFSKMLKKGSTMVLDRVSSVEDV